MTIFFGGGGLLSKEAKAFGSAERARSLPSQTDVLCEFSHYFAAVLL